MKAVDLLLIIPICFFVFSAISTIFFNLSKHNNKYDYVRLGNYKLDNFHSLSNYAFCSLFPNKNNLSDYIWSHRASVRYDNTTDNTLDLHNMVDGSSDALYILLTNKISRFDIDVVICPSTNNIIVAHPSVVNNLTIPYFQTLKSFLESVHHHLFQYKALLTKQIEPIITIEPKFQSNSSNLKLLLSIISQSPLIPFISVIANRKSIFRKITTLIQDGNMSINIAIAYRSIPIGSVNDMFSMDSGILSDGGRVHMPDIALLQSYKHCKTIATSGSLVVAWIVDSQEEMLQMLSLQCPVSVKGVITNRPLWMTRFLLQMHTEHC